jgi:hypothetical protein
MFLEVKQGDRVWEDYNRDRSGKVQKIFKGSKGATYCEVLWDAVANVLGEMGQPVLAPKVNAKALRSDRNPKFMNEAERAAALPPPIPEPVRKNYALTNEELHLIVGALKAYTVRPQVRYKLGLLLERLGA